MEEKKIFLRNFQAQSQTYLEILSWYRSEIGWYLNNGKNKIHTVPFLLTTAAALECSLNDHIINHYTKTFGKNAGLLIPGLLSMTLKGKLLNIVPLLTSNKYILNIENLIYQRLSELIKLRNRFVHNKSDYDTHEAFIKENDKGEPYIEIPQELQDKIDGKIDPSLGVDKDISIYHEALEELHNLFFDRYKEENFNGNDLITPLEIEEVDTIIIEDNKA